MHIQAPAGPVEARSAVKRYLGRNKTMLDDYIIYYIDSLEDDETWSEIGRCIALYHEVLVSVRKPYKSKWYKKEIQVNDEVKYTWVNVLQGFESKRLYGTEQMKDLRLAVGLCADKHHMFSCLSVVWRWKSYYQQSHEMCRAEYRVASLFEELIKVSCHPKRYFSNCIGEDVL
jgi:hypothetical protein